jgi:amino acid transporter
MPGSRPPWSCSSRSPRRSAASSIAEFAGRLPSAGSLYTYNSRGLGQAGGFLTGWMMIFAYALYVPAGIALTSAYASQLVADTLHLTIAGWVLFIVILAAVVLVAYLGIGASSWVDMVLVTGEVAVIAALAITILVKVGPAHYSAAVLVPGSSPHGQLTDITNAMIFGITAFAGFEAAAALGEEARNTRRAIPAFTIGVVIVAGVFYLVVVLAEMFGVGRQGIPGFVAQQNPLVYLASQYWSPSAQWTIDVVVVLTGLGFVVASLNVSIRVLFAMGRERALPASLARLSGRHTPVVSIGCVALLALALGLPLTYLHGGLRTFGYLAGAGGLSVVLVYLAVNVAIIRAFRTEFRGSSGSGGTCWCPPWPPPCSCSRCGGSFIRAPTGWRICCPSSRSAGSAWAPSPLVSSAPGGPPASRRWAGYSRPPVITPRWVTT